jgi:hypothetical protein
MAANSIGEGTLQELIAPSSLIFFNNSWEEIGTKSSLQPIISNITGIHLEALSVFVPEDFSIAQRMSWAANRRTTRIEDLAYCLMGLFGVNMPMLYGEESRAFIRLQEEIMKVSDDDSIFVWKFSRFFPTDGSGLLAPFPEAFAKSGKVIRCNDVTSKPFALTNKGISIKMPPTSRKTADTRVALLNCKVSGMDDKFIGIILKGSSIDSQFTRLWGKDWVMVEKREAKSLPTSELYIKATGSNWKNVPICRCHISTATLGEYGFLLEGIYYERDTIQEVKPSNWISGTLTNGMVAVLRIEDIHGAPFLVLLKAEGGLLLVDVEKADGTESLKEVFSLFNPRSNPQSSRLYKRGTWRNESDRVSWQQPNGTWIVSVATKNQIIDGEMGQAVIITGHAPLKNPGEMHRAR